MNSPEGDQVEIQSAGRLMLGIPVSGTGLTSAMAIYDFTIGADGFIPNLTSGQQASKLGKVEFPNSCGPAVQEKLLRGIAMLHSFYYSAAQKAFEAVPVITWSMA